MSELITRLPAQTQRARRLGELFDVFISAIKRRWARERRRRKVGRAYDMALEIARTIPRGAEVLDVGCGNGFIAHHLSAMLGTSVQGIDVEDKTEASIDYRRFDGARIPFAANSFDAVLLCYVLHHAHDAQAMLSELRRVLRAGGLAVIYEDIPQTSWDKGVCWIHNRQWQGRTGPCTFRNESEWRAVFESSGFEIIEQRRLSRWRNLAHPVCRTLYTLEVGTIEPRKTVKRLFDLRSDSDPSHEILKTWVGSKIVQPRIKAQHRRRQRPFIESLLKILEGFILFTESGINYRFLVWRNMRESGSLIEFLNRVSRFVLISQYRMDVPERSQSIVAAG